MVQVKGNSTELIIDKKLSTSTFDALTKGKNCFIVRQDE